MSQTIRISRSNKGQGISYDLDAIIVDDSGDGSYELEVACLYIGELANVLGPEIAAAAESRLLRRGDHITIELTAKVLP